MSRFWGSPDEQHSPQCNKCKYHHSGEFTCDVYPDRIPDEILLNKADHRNPYPGDHGIRFEPLEEEDGKKEG